MENKPLVSILIVTYNPEKYLENTLRSCLDQTYQNTEILILDNNSSEDIAKSIIGLQDYRITEKQEKSNETLFTLREIVNLGNCKTIQLIKSPENLGPYRGLNKLLDEARGDYIAIQDHDDIWHPDKITKQVEFLENHREYVGCGTNTIMYYEADRKYFEYFLEEKNYYTIHPSLIFRNNQTFHYDTKMEYMCDAYSLKYNLCGGEKKIYNLSESLTLHLIKSTSANYSYKWHRLTRENIKRAYELHSFLYATLTIGWEIKRKLAYPILNILGIGKWINPIERIPFRLMGKQIKTTQGDEWWSKLI